MSAATAVAEDRDTDEDDKKESSSSNPCNYDNVLEGEERLVRVAGGRLALSFIIVRDGDWTLWVDSQ